MMQKGMVQAGPPAEEKPSFLTILCDQLNPAVLDLYGGPVNMPNLGRLADRGLVFDQAICPFPVCSPSRASLALGQYPHRHGIIHNCMKKDYPRHNQDPALLDEGIENRDPTLDKILNTEGYETHHYGKWHLSGDDLDYYPDMYSEHLHYSREMSHRFAAIRRRDRETWMDWYGWALPVRRTPAYEKAAGRLLDSMGGKHSPYIDFVSKIGRLQFDEADLFDFRAVDRAITAVRNSSGPFSITVGLNYPHDPNVIPAPYYHLIDPDGIELPDSGIREKRLESSWSRTLVKGLGEEGLREFLRVYYTSCLFIDAELGRILDCLEEQDRIDDTVILFSADHGDMTGKHGMIWKSCDAFYEELVRIPFLLSYPKRFRPRRVTKSASLVDVLPTFLSLAGIAAPAGIDGEDLCPYLLGKKTPDPDADFRFCQRLEADPLHRRRFHRRGSYMIRNRKWKYALYSDGDQWLFDLDNDPGETRNLAGDQRYEDVRAELKERLGSFMEEAMESGSN